MKNTNLKTGQIAIMLVLIIVVLTTITTAAVAVAISSTRDTTTLTLGEEALSIAESGAENAILRLLRDSTYAGEVGLPIGLGNATITVTGTTTKTITSKGVLGTMVRTIQATVSNSSGQYTVSNWHEL